MGKGLQRIAALTASATAALMAVGAIEVGALVGVSAPTVTTTVPQLTVTAPETTVTVPETTVTVPSTPVTPKTTVTTPTVKTPPPPAPKVSTPKVTTPKVSAPTGGSGSGSGSTTQKIVSGVTDTVGGGGSAGGGSSGGSASPTGTVTDMLSTGTSALGSGSGGGAGAGSAGSGSSALQALGFFGGGSGSGGTGGPAGPAGPGGASGGQNVFAAGGRGGGLPPTLTAAQAKQLRSALALLEGCMSAIAPLDRQVLAMRAGTGGTGPLARSQVAARLGVPARQVRLSERRGLSGLRTAAAETGCAGAAGGPFSVAGIAMSPLLAFATANQGGAGVASADAGSGGYIAAREAGPGAESPLARLTDGGESGPAWLIVLVTVLFSVAVAALTRELRTSLGAPRY